MNDTTLNALRLNGYRVIVTCAGDGCQPAAMSVDELIVAFGPSFAGSAEELSKRLMCRRCGRRDVAVTVLGPDR